MSGSEHDSLSARLRERVATAIDEGGGWLPFDRFMATVLYEPGLGYYSRGAMPIGLMPRDGSDFVTAPQISPLFGRALARQLAQALQASATEEIWEFGAGTGALAAQLIDELDRLGAPLRRYVILDLSGTLVAAQRAALARFADRVQWVSAWPERLDGVVVGNEVLDAMPVQLLHWDGLAWSERGVALGPAQALVWQDRATGLRPPVDGHFMPGTVTELHNQAEAFVRTLAAALGRGAAFFIDYGFPEAEYYHPQRQGGTLMCHQAHRADGDPLADVGAKDITAHVNFSGVALTAQAAGMQVLGYTSQARFLLNCGLTTLLAEADLRERAMAGKLVNEHEMGELFKVIGLAKGVDFDALGFVQGDRCHRL